MSLLPSILGPGNERASKRGGLILLVQAGSLLATGWLVWSAALVPRLRFQPLGNLLIQAAGYAILAWTWSAVIAFGLYAIVPAEERAGMVPSVLRTAATAVWFSPAMILLSGFSPAALLAALVLVVSTSRLLYSQWRQTQPEPPPPLPYTPHEPGSFADCPLPRSFVLRELVPSLAVAFCLEAGVIAVMLHYPLLGAGWLCMGTALVTVFSMSTGAADAGRPPTLPRSVLGVLATMILAVMLTLGGVRGFGIPGFSAGGGRFTGERPGLIETARAVLRQLFYGERPAGMRGTGTNPPAPPPAPDTGAVGGYPGVILWPEIKPVVTLIAPPPQPGMGLFQGRDPKPLGIPFAGEYWMFRWPFSRPPQRSFFQRGNPADMAFSTTDRTLLQMEAHQKLDTPIALNCCSRLQIEIANADRYPGTVALELVLSDSESARRMSVSLGKAPVTSAPDLTKDPVMAVRETLDFNVPAAPALEEFDELKVVFHRDRSRMDKSAKIAIERFVLVPR